MTNLYQSFWTKPALELLCLKENLIINALSCCNAKAAGYALNMHTDYEGKQLLDFLPYDNVYETLDNLNVPTAMKALAKIKAHLNEPLGSIHIDNDVFLYKYQDLKFADFITQWGPRGISEDTKMNKYKEILKPILSEELYNLNYTYHCGLVGFNNKTLKDSYCKAYLEYVDKINQIDSSIFDVRTLNIDDVLEETLLALMSKEYRNTAIFKGFYHRNSWLFHDIGPYKYSKCDGYLLEIKFKYPDIYNILIAKLNELNISVKNQRFVHSFWTKPALVSMRNMKLILRLTAISAMYIKKCGGTIVLYTDNIGAEIFKDIPYDEVHVILDEIPPEINYTFFAYSKFVAMEHEPLGSVHIDFDLFIKKPELINLIADADYDIIFLETWDDTVSEKALSYNQNLLKRFIEPYGLYGLRTSPCTGILGWKNQELKDLCINTYKKLVWECCTDPEMKEILKLRDVKLVPDLIIEQLLLYVLSKPYKVFNLLQYYNKHLVGLNHLFTLNKYMPNVLFDSVCELEKLNPELNKIVSNYGNNL